MLLEESFWFRKVIRERIAPGSLVLNIGSSTRHYVEVLQPYIKKNVIDELAQKNCIVKNIDIKSSDGVDMVGDICSPVFAEELRLLAPAAIICASVLEQVADRAAFSRALESLVAGKTILIVSVPRSFPYHEDPIDTLYRPNLKDLTQEFPSLRLVEGEVVSGGLYFSLIARKLGMAGKAWFFVKRIVKFLLLCATFRFKGAADVGWSFRIVRATCAVFERPTTAE